jgi:hypothetical protein
MMTFPLDRHTDYSVWRSNIYINILTNGITDAILLLLKAVPPFWRIPMPNAGHTQTERQRDALRRKKERKMENRRREQREAQELHTTVIELRRNHAEEAAKICAKEKRNPTKVGTQCYPHQVEWW